MFIKLFIAFHFLFLPELNTYSLNVTVENIPSTKGQILIAVYNKKEGFRDKNATYANLTKPATSGTMTFSFPSLPKGDYAVAIFHDKNNNGKLDKNLLGIPKEYYGFSNNAKGKFGPPSYDQCKIELNRDKQISVRLK